MQYSAGMAFDAPTTPDTASLLRKRQRAYQAVFGSEDGRLVFGELLSHTAHEAASMPAGSDIALFDAGRAFVGKKVIEMVRRFAPNEWLEFEAARLNQLERQLRAEIAAEEAEPVDPSGPDPDDE